MKSRWLAVLVVLLAASPAVAQQALEEIPEAVVLGFNPAENAQALQSSADDLARLLTERVHIPVRAFVTLDYTALVEAMRAGQVHFGWLTPSPLVLAERMFGAEVVLTQVRRGKPTYYGAIVVREDSPVRSVEDLRGRSIAWVDPQSTSGFIIPRYLLLQRGLDVEHLFSQQVFAGGHDAAVFAVQNGQVAAAAVWADPPGEGTGAWTRYTRQRPEPRMRPILYSPPVPSDAVAVHPEFGRTHPRLVASVRQALVAIGQSAGGRQVLGHLNSTDGFVEANPAAYDLVRRAFQASRTASRSSGGRFDRPRSVATFAALIVAIGLLSLPWWKRHARARARAGWAVFLVAIAWALNDAQLALGDLLRGSGSMRAFVAGMFPLDGAVVPQVIESSIATLQLALIGTVLSVPFGLVAAFLAAENVNPSRPVRTVVRFLLNLNRSVDTLIVALVLVSAVGLGPLPGVCALAIHGVGALGKLLYEAIETLDPGPVEAMRAVGGSPLRVIRWGIWPQLAPHFVSIVLFRFELNVRVSTVLGLVGAGGIGFLLMTYMRGAEYAKVSVVVTAIVALVMALDAVSTALRRRVA